MLQNLKLFKALAGGMFNALGVGVIRLSDAVLPCFAAVCLAVAFPASIKAATAHGGHSVQNVAPIDVARPTGKDGGVCALFNEEISPHTCGFIKFFAPVPTQIQPVGEVGQKASRQQSKEERIEAVTIEELRQELDTLHERVYVIGGLVVHFLLYLSGAMVVLIAGALLLFLRELLYWVWDMFIFDIAPALKKVWRVTFCRTSKP